MICKRCGYDCAYKYLLKRHLNRKIPCEPLQNDISVEYLLEEINNDDLTNKRFKCIFCAKLFTDPSNKLKHQKICNSRIDQLKEIVEKLVIKNNDLEKKSLNNVNINLELQYYKNRKNEKFYQLLLENYLGRTHKTLSCGVTDITTDKCHAEIK